VAGGYLSALQAGLQTAHVVGELSCIDSTDEFGRSSNWKFEQWASKDKVIIICNAFNSAGVKEAFERFSTFAKQFSLPCAIFHEDEQSLNGAATACGVIVPECFWNVSLHSNTGSYDVYTKIDGVNTPGEIYFPNTDEHNFVELLKSYSLFR